MFVIENNDKPIFQQIAEQIEDGILSGVFIEEEQVPSTTEISSTYKINPATVLKGMNILVEKGILYKKRGVGMFVTQGATKQIQGERKEQFYTEFIEPMLKEAEKININTQAIIELLKGVEKE